MGVVGYIRNIFNKKKTEDAGVRTVGGGSNTPSQSIELGNYADSPEKLRQAVSDAGVQSGLSQEAKNILSRARESSLRGGSSGSGGSGGISVQTPTQQVEDMQSISPKTRQPTQAELRNQQLVDNMRTSGSNRIAEQNARIIAEQKRIERERLKILAKDGKEQIGTYTDVKTGQKQEIKRLKAGADKIVEVKNLDTGVTTITTYGTGKGGGSVRQTGGIVVKESPKEQVGDNLFFDKIDEAKKEGERKLNLLGYKSEVEIKRQPTEWEIQPAPTLKEKYKKSVGESGYVKGTLSFLGSEASILAWKGQEISVKKYGGKYDPQFAELQGQIVETAPYFIPGGVGAGIILASGAEELGTESGRERIQEQSKYFQEEKGFGGTTSNIIAYGIPIAEVGIGTLGLKAEFGTPSYLRGGERVVTVSPETKVIRKTIDIRGTEGRYLNIEGERNLLFKSRPKGSVSVVQETSTGNWFGTVEEIQKGGLFRKPKVFKGEVKLVDGKYTETINYPKNIRKVTEVKEGEQITSIFKKDKLISKVKEQYIEPPQPQIKYDTLESTKQIKLGTGGKTKVTTGDLQGFKIKNINQRDLRTGLLSKDIKGSIGFGEDISSGVSVRVQRGSSLIDITRTKPRSIVRSKRTGMDTITEKELFNPEVIYAEGKVPKSKDYTAFTKIDEGEQLLKIQQGNIDRVIQQKENIKVITRFKTPKKNIKVVDQPKPIELEAPRERPKRFDFQERKYDPVSFKNLELIQKEKITIQRPETYLEKMENIILPRIPKLSEVKQKVSNIKVGNIFGGTTIPSVSAKEVRVESNIIDFKSNQVTRQSTKQELKKEEITILKPEQKSSQRQEEATLQSQSQRQESKQTQQQKQVLKQMTKQIQKQQLQQQPIQLQTPKLTQPKPPQPKTPKPIILPKLPGIAKRMLEKIEEQPETFEAVGIRFGKEVSLGKGSKEQTASKLSKFLSGTLGASGFLKTGGEKIRASETGLLKKESFRVSKKDPFKVVEKKTSRLKTGTQEVPEIQFFKKKTTKKRK